MALGTIIRSFAIPGAVSIGMDFDGRYLYVANSTTNLIYRIDPVTGTVVNSFATPNTNPRGIAVVGSDLYHVTLTGRTIYQLNKQTGTVKRSFQSPNTLPQGLCWDGRHLWNVDSGQRRIYQIDPTEGGFIRSFVTPSTTPIGLAWDGRSLWHCDGTADRIYQIDPNTGVVIQSVASPSLNPGGLAWDGRTLWHIDYATDLAYQLSVSSWGRSYYVDATGGNDANSGESAAQPWQTIGKVNGETFSPGDRIYFKRGETWTGTLLNVTWSGIAGHPITFGAYGAGNNPIIDGNDVVNCVTATGQSFLHFENLDITQGSAFGFSFVTCTNIDLVDCDAHDCGGDNLIFNTSCSDCAVLRGEFYAGYQGGAGIVTGIEIADGSHDITITDAVCRNQLGANVGMGISIHSHVATALPYNITLSGVTCHTNASNGIQIIKQDNAADVDRNILISNCTVYGNTDDGIRIAKSVGATNYPVGVTVEQTVSRDNTRYAAYIEGDDHSINRSLFHEGRMLRFGNGNGLTIYNCTFYLTAYAGFRPIEIMTAGDTQNVEVKNCIIASPDNTCYMIAFAAATITGADVDYNLYYNTGDLTVLTRFSWNGAGKNWNNWRTDSGQDSNSPTPADPLFANPGADDFTLQVASPARGVGTDLGYGTDLGAYQYGS